MILRLSRLAILNYRSIKFCSARPNSTKPTEDISRPVVYTRSAANQWKAQYSREGGPNTRLWYEPYVVLTSIAVFLIYFCILREESDIDRKFDKSLYDHIEGLEEKQLIISLKYNEEHGLDTKAIVTRLEELAKDNKK
ncbi:hypothetical protein PPYR_12803 [Photinus pyralis]|uniref:Uncharacterized protein n=1 Tax=Photinus pyralis TaxID=7054 RepID=A0A1Y1LVN6_PHOPY|nr:uncharacterized protein LOC116178489 [Photinus pyralis]KAB0793183.1 hypothetical protein PPYR_12803 [Photinus pyralis]